VITARKIKKSLGRKKINIYGEISGQTHLTAPLISPKAKKILDFFLVKDLFFL